MTQPNHKQTVLDALVQRTDGYHAAQPAREALRDDTALDCWQLLFNEGSYTKARKCWFEIVEPTTRLAND
jgi:hypothetical protein